MPALLELRRTPDIPPATWLKETVPREVSWPSLGLEGPLTAGLQAWKFSEHQHPRDAGFGEGTLNVHLVPWFSDIL